MKKFVAALVAAVMLMGAFDLSAAPREKKDKGKKSAEARFKKLDANSDGKLSKEEFVGKRKEKGKERAEKVFARRDKNGDGSLSLEEFSAKPAKKGKKKGKDKKDA